MRSAEERKVNVLETKCDKLVGVSRMDRVRNEEVRRKAGIQRESGNSGSESIKMAWTCGENE